MADEYEDFSDEEAERENSNRARTNNNNNDDEQIVQKMNERVEVLEAEISSLKSQVKKLKHENNELQKKHEYVPSHIHKSHEEVVAEHMHANKIEIEQLKADLAKAQAACIPKLLTDAFAQFVSKCGIPIDVVDKHHHTPAKYADVLKFAAKQLAKIKKELDESPPAGDENELTQKIMNLREELRLALNAAEDIRALKGKLMQMIERVRLEKEGKMKAEAEYQSCRKKSEILTDHMEKLMSHLRHEAGVKTRILKQLKESEELNVQLKQNYAILMKKNNSKDRFIVEMHEGSKVLEDQLKLMDEKYLDLRAKLDWAREYGNRKLQKAEKVASDLRAKYTMLTGGTALLDNIHVNYSFDANSSFDDGQSLGSTTPSISGQSAVSFKSQSSKASRNRKSKKLQPLSDTNDHSKTRTPDIDQVLNKIKRKQEHNNATKREWTEESMRELVKSR